MYRHENILYSNINGTIFVYNLDKIDPSSGNYQLIQTI